jgi:hypothetical protein
MPARCQRSTQRGSIHRVTGFHQSEPVFYCEEVSDYPTGGRHVARRARNRMELLDVAEAEGRAGAMRWLSGSEASRTRPSRPVPHHPEPAHRKARWLLRHPRLGRRQRQHGSKITDKVVEEMNEWANRPLARPVNRGLSRATRPATCGSPAQRRTILLQPRFVSQRLSARPSMDGSARSGETPACRSMSRGSRAQSPDEPTGSCPLRGQVVLATAATARNV